MQSVSVVMITSPGREPFLERALRLLAQQDYPFFEVIVVDDGSLGGREVVEQWHQDQPVHYLWRPNDACPARSRNRGAAQSRYEILIFLDSDILINPSGLSAYVAWLTGHPNWLIYGYCGTDLSWRSPSFLSEGADVQFKDKRFSLSKEGVLSPLPWLFHSPQELAFAGNMAIYRQCWESLGGFDERFVGWGGEDLAFGTTALHKGRELHFLLDAWAEHQHHSRQEDFHHRPSDTRAHGFTFMPHGWPHYQVRCLETSMGRTSLQKALWHCLQTGQEYFAC